MNENSKNGFVELATEQDFPVLEFHNLSKTFSGQLALSNVSLTVLRNEVHGLLGQNGSGKSTLIKILAGFHEPDSGSKLNINNESIPLPLVPGEFLKLGLSFVHQDLGLVTSLSVADNLNLYELASRDKWFIGKRKTYDAAHELLKSYNLPFNPWASVSDLSQTERALLAIVRAVHALRHNRSSDAKNGLLILDEPTAFLPLEGKQQLFNLIQAVVQDGISVLFVSHDLDEVMEITDKVTVLRDGLVTCTANTKELTKAELVEVITGKKIESLQHHVNSKHDLGNVVLQVQNLTGQTVENIGFDVHQGEVLGLTGLLGSGFDELPYLMFGAKAAEGGTVTVNGKLLPKSSLSPLLAMKHGVALLPADRQALSGVGALTVADNATILTLPKYRGKLGLSRRKMLTATKSLGERLEFRPNMPEKLLGLLSGGNQQKVLIGKWLQTNPLVLILHEPTQGIDVGARQQVYQLIREVTQNGVSVVCASADFEQLEQICDRVLVFTRGRVAGELTETHITKDNIFAMCYELHTKSS